MHTRIVRSFVVVFSVYGSGCSCDADPPVTAESACPEAGTPGLELCTSFDADTGSTVRDESGHGLVGMLQGAATIVDGGRRGKAAHFTGADADSIDFGETLALTGAVTVEAWLKIDVATTWAAGVSRWQADHGYWLGGSLTPGGFEFWIERDHADSPRDVLRMGEWQHLAGSYDPATREVLLYLNGRRVGSRVRPATTELMVAPITFGLGRSGGSFTTLNGSIDEVRVWSVVRTPAQICDAAGGAMAIGGDCHGSLPDGAIADAAVDAPSSVDAGVVPLCPGRTITIARLDAAHAALAGGATTADISGDGCIVLRRMTAGAETIDEVVYDGVVSRRWRLGPTMVIGDADDDGDRAFDWHAEITLGPTEASRMVIDATHAASRTARRETYTLSADATTIHVRIETDRATGTLTLESEFDIPRLQDQSVTGPAPGTGPGSCNATQAAEYQQAMEDAIADALMCAQDVGWSGLASFLTHTVPTRGIELRCADVPGRCAEIDIWSSITSTLGLGSSRIGISVNPGLISTAACGGSPSNVMMHELMHAFVGAHDPYEDFSSPASKRHDRSYACTAMCTDPMATKCECASCLRTDICDPRCSRFRECTDPDQGGWCLCLFNRRSYPAYSTCLAECPSGLACFGSTCRRLDLRCPPP